MENMLFHAHSGLRYLVLVAGVAALVFAGLGMSRGGGGTKRGRIAMAVYVGTLDLQLLLGLILLLTWTFYGQLIGHLVLMVLAAATAHAGSVIARRREASAARIRLITILLSLILIIGGITAIGRPIL